MFGYYLRLAARSLRATPALTTLMIATIALGVGIFMAALTVYYLMASNPIPHKSDVLFAVQLDSWDPAEPWDDDQPEQAPWELTYRDAMALRESAIPVRQIAMHKVGLIIEPAREGVNPFKATGRLTGGDFFAMFDIPFVYGTSWDDSADENGAHVVVLSETMNEQLFGGKDSVGETLRIDSRDFRVIGVTETWNPSPKYYDVNNGPFDDAEEIFVPIGVGRELELFSEGNTNCWKDEELRGFEDFLGSECVWWQYWVELETPAQRDAYQAYLDGYVTSQKALGRFGRPLNNKLTNVSDWLDVRRVVQDDAKVFVGLAFMFLGVCLFNTVGLMLTKFLGKAPQIGIRRALGARRSSVLGQQLIEVGTIGAFGGLAGLALAFVALLGIKQLFPDIEQLVRMNLTLVGIAVVIAVITTVLAGLYPAWRVCRLPPAGYLRLQ